MVLRNGGILPQHYTASQLRRTWLKSSVPWKPQISQQNSYRSSLYYVYMLIHIYAENVSEGDKIWRSCYYYCSPVSERINRVHYVMKIWENELMYLINHHDVSKLSCTIYRLESMFQNISNSFYSFFLSIVLPYMFYPGLNNLWSVPLESIHTYLYIHTNNARFQVSMVMRILGCAAV
jgi:hypothetical protein